jgi:hypothetical protein
LGDDGSAKSALSNASDFWYIALSHWAFWPEETAQMRCPHCTTDFHEDWASSVVINEQKGQIILSLFQGLQEVIWHYRTSVCSKCKDMVIEIAPLRTGTRLLLSDSVRKGRA